MIVDFNDPASVLAWLRTAPKRIGAQLQAFRVLWPQFAHVIDEAVEMGKQARGVHGKANE